MQLRLAISLILMVIFVVPSDASQQDLVSGKLSGINDEVRIAYSPHSGNALIVWTNSHFEEKESSRIYGAEVFTHPDGSIEFSEYFLISKDSGNNSRPKVLFVPEYSRYLICWDTSNPDIADYRVTDDRLPENSSHVLLRTYAPKGLSAPDIISEGKLGEIITVSGHNNIRNAFNAQVSLIRNSKDSLELLFFYSAKRWEADEKSFDLLASVWEIGTDEPRPAANADIEIKIVDKAKVITEESVIAVGGAFKDGNYYLSAKSLNNRGESLPKFFKINYQTLEVEKEILLSTEYLESSLNVMGDFKPIFDTGISEEASEFRLAGYYNDKDALISVDNEYLEKSVKVTESLLRDEDQVYLVDFFDVEKDDKTGGTYILCAINNTILRYRKISPANGKPQGGSKLAMVFSQEELNSFDAKFTGDEAFLAYSVRISKKKAKIYFATFKVE